MTGRKGAEKVFLAEETACTRAWKALLVPENASDLLWPMGTVRKERKWWGQRERPMPLGNHAFIQPHPPSSPCFPTPIPLPGDCDSVMGFSHPPALSLAQFLYLSKCVIHQQIMSHHRSTLWVPKCQLIITDSTTNLPVFHKAKEFQHKNRASINSCDTARCTAHRCPGKFCSIGKGGITL